LDEDTTGLLLMTDDGQFIHTYTSPKKLIPKVYLVTTKHGVDDAQVSALLAGVTLNDDPVPVRATACERVDDRVLRLTVTEGKYHLVKRMIAATSNRVDALHRVSVGGFGLPSSLAEGQWIWLEEADLERLATGKMDS
jgi:16S rRNA pseudouridine516 synthase